MPSLERRFQVTVDLFSSLFSDVALLFLFLIYFGQIPINYFQIHFKLSMVLGCSYMVICLATCTLIK